MAVVYMKAGTLCVRLEKDEKWRLEGCPTRPEKASPDKHIYTVESNRSCIDWIRANFSVKEIAPRADEFMKTRVQAEVPDVPFPANHQFRIHPPFSGPLDHQREVLDRAWCKDAFAVFHEMGCGKSMVAINLAAAYWEADDIWGVLIVCPTSIKFNWEKELAKHWPETSEYDAWTLEPGNMSSVDTWIHEDSPKCKVLIVGVEALSQGGAWMKAEKFVRCVECITIVDESSRIKTPWRLDKKKQKLISGIRTYRCIELGKQSKRRLAMTGTSVTQGLQDLYSQFEFLDPAIIGSSNYWAFRNAYCVMGGAMGKQIVGYRDTQKLFRLLRPYTDVKLLDDVSDVPQGVTDELRVRMTPTQKQLIKRLKEEMMAEYEGRAIELNTILEFMLRAQQVVGGFMPVTKEDVHLLKQSESKYECVPLKENPKMDAALEWANDLQGKGIIWARFIPEIEAISRNLDMPHVKFYGATSAEERREAVQKFEDPDSDVKIFLGNPATGGIGIDLVQGRQVLYYSNSFSLETRLQSMARSRRIIQTETVHYVDLLSDARIDKSLAESIIKKKSISDYANEMLSMEELF